MISVKQHGTNYFTLKGLCLSERTFSESTIAISGSGFRIELRFEPSGFLHAEMLRRRQVVPKLKEMLEEYRTDEDVNEAEINHYLGVLEKFANERPEQFPKVESGKRWAICQFYEPFVMGGNVWQWRRFAVEADDVELVEDFIGFVFYDELTKEWRVHEKTTGGMLGEGPTKEEAIAKANYNINETPDLREQMKTLGDTTKFPEVPAEDALRRIANKKQ